VTGAAGAEPARRILAAITDKRAGHRLSSDTIAEVVGDFAAGRTPDYQMAALLATIACAGLDLAETAALTDAYVRSGQTLRPTRPVVDKHSTGGVGDKVTLVVAPMVAACGMPVLKLSGRGLGFAGGTIDKLESISGLRLDLCASEVLQMVDRVGMVIAGQSAGLVPGDGRTYALRDVTATVDSIPLIAASVMSKKIACGSRGVVLDVKHGEGALVPDPGQARALARLMLALGTRFGLPGVAVLSDMSQPLGRAVGNALEVKEALAVLRGEEVPGLTGLCDLIAALMLRLGDARLDAATATRQVRAARTSGAGYDVFARWVAAQGGAVEQIRNPDLLPGAAHHDLVRAPAAGWVTAISARRVGEAAALAGAGRLRLGDPVDHGAGVLLHRQAGDRVAAGQPLAELHCTEGSRAAALASLTAAFQVGPEPPATVPGHEVLAAEVAVDHLA
jgi:pyrimidine-nucleoside phosphorylase/thymidine phosphorylase